MSPSSSMAPSWRTSWGSIPHEVGRIVRYFEERGFLKHIAGGGLTIRITAAGIDHVETAPDEPLPDP
jgi:hypothetical protein